MHVYCAMFSYCYIPYTTDPLHGYYALCGLSLLHEDGLGDMHPALGISVTAFQHLQNLHQRWQSTDNLNSDLKSCGLT